MAEGRAFREERPVRAKALGEEEAVCVSEEQREARLGARNKGMNRNCNNKDRQCSIWTFSFSFIFFYFE